MASERVFLVVVDDSPEMQAALRYACLRVKALNGRVALLRVIPPGEFQHFMGISALMQAEAEAEAETLLERLSKDVEALSGHPPRLFVRTGTSRDVVIALIAEEPEISILVLAADTGANGPGPLVTALSGKFVGNLRVPLTIVPGNLTPEAIDAIASG